MWGGLSSQPVHADVFVILSSSLLASSSHTVSSVFSTARLWISHISRVLLLSSFHSFSVWWGGWMG